MMLTPEELDAIEAHVRDGYPLGEVRSLAIIAALREAWDAYGRMEQRYEQERAWGAEARAEVERLRNALAAYGDVVKMLDGEA